MIVSARWGHPLISYYDWYNVDQKFVHVSMYYSPLCIPHWVTHMAGQLSWRAAVLVDMDVRTQFAFTVSLLQCKRMKVTVPRLLDVHWQKAHQQQNTYSYRTTILKSTFINQRSYNSGLIRFTCVWSHKIAPSWCLTLPLLAITRVTSYLPAARKRRTKKCRSASADA